MTRDWLPHTPPQISRRRRSRNIKDIYRSVRKAIAEADLLIVEDTVSDFATGHQITLGLQRRKPVLVMHLDDPKGSFADTLLDGIESDYLQVSTYDLDNYQQIIQEFIAKYEDAGNKHRFNLVIDEVERKYLEWAKYRYGQSRTRIIRTALRKAIEQDKDYSKYLRRGMSINS